MSVRILGIAAIAAPDTLACRVREVRHCFRALRGICLDYPALPRLLEMADAPLPSVVAPMDVALGALAAAGLSKPDSLRAYFTLVGVTLSHAAYQARGPFPGLEPPERGRPGPPDWDFDAAFEFALTLILDGIAVQATRLGAGNPSIDQRQMAESRSRPV